jgi:hypothetical protein
VARPLQLSKSGSFAFVKQFPTPVAFSKQDCFTTLEISNMQDRFKIYCHLK